MGNTGWAVVGFLAGGLSMYLLMRYTGFGAQVVPSMTITPSGVQVSGV